MPLPKPCSKCEIRFKPNTKNNKMCDKCRDHRFKNSCMKKEKVREDQMAFVKAKNSFGKYYKNLIPCKICKQYYGSNLEYDNKICPKCSWTGKKVRGT